MSLYVTLQSEIKALLQESKRRHPNVKDAAEKALQRITSLPNKNPSLTEIKDMCASEDIWRPLILACDSKNPKIISMALGSLQRLITHNVVPQVSLINVVSCVSRIEWDKDNTTDETLQLKLLQVFVVLLHHRRLSTTCPYGPGEVVEGLYPHML